jgi:nitroreductase
MDTRQLFTSRRAVRQFSSEPLPENARRFILDAGRRSASAKNTQPWAFIAVSDRGTLERLSHTGTYAGHLAGAAFGVAILTPDPSSRWSILFDAGQAAAQMQLAAWSLGIGACPATIYEPEQARQILGFPDEYFLNVILSFGYPADPATLSQPLRAGGRRGFDETVHLDRW